MSSNKNSYESQKEDAFNLLALVALIAVFYYAVVGLIWGTKKTHAGIASAVGSSEDATAIMFCGSIFLALAFIAFLSFAFR